MYIYFIYVKIIEHSILIMVAHINRKSRDKSKKPYFV